jgi:hypothetical protein
MRNVLTYSKLVKHAMKLRSQSPGHFKALCENGTTSLIPGLKITWSLGRNDARFKVDVEVKKGKDKGEFARFMQVYGNKRHGRWYSYYTFDFLTTEFRSSWMNRWTPVSLPLGVASASRNHGGRTPMLYFGPNGVPDTENYEWQGGKRGMQGGPVTPLVVDDETGEKVGGLKVGQLGLDRTNECGPGDLGFYPTAIEDRREWVESVKQIPGIDQRTCMEAAVRTLKCGVEITRDYPGVGMFLFKAEQGPRDEYLPNDEYRTQADGVYLAPELVLYWSEGRGPYGDAKWTFLTMTVPPHGSEGMDPTGKVSPVTRRSCTTERHSYQNFVCRLPETNGDRHCRVQSSNTMKYGADHYCKELEQSLVFWPDHKDKVMVYIRGDVPSPLPHSDYLAMQPQHVQSLLNEKMLLESLPLC